MYSWKSIGPRMQPSGNPSLTGYSCEDFPSRTTRSHLLLRKEEIRPNIWPEIPQDLSLRSRTACQTLSKTLYIKSYSSSSPRLAILSDTTVRRSVFDRKDPKPYWKSETRPHFSSWSTITLFIRLYLPEKED